MGLELRTATAADVDAALPLIYSSGPATFDYVFVTRSRDDVFGFLRRAFIGNAGEFGHVLHTVAVVDGAVAGIGTAFSGDTALRFMVEGARCIWGYYGTIAGAGVVLRALRVERIVQPPKGPLHYIAHLGVTPELRGRGIGAALLEHLFEEGRRAGRVTAALDVAVTNPRAQLLYERMGFRVTAERPSRLRNRHATVPAHRRMERAL